MVSEKGKQAARDECIIEPPFPDITSYRMFKESENKILQHLWNASKALSRDPENLKHPEWEGWNIWDRFFTIKSLSEEIDAKATQMQQRRKKERELKEERMAWLQNNLEKLTHVTKALCQQNDMLKKETVALGKQLRDAGIQPKKIIHQPIVIPTSPASPDTTPVPVGAVQSLPSRPKPQTPPPPSKTAEPRTPVAQQETSPSTSSSSSPGSPNLPPSPEINTDSISTDASGDDSPDTSPLPSPKGKLVRFPAPVADYTGTRPAFEYEFSDNVRVIRNALYNPELRNGAPSDKSRTALARSGPHKVKVSISADYPSPVHRLEGDEIVYPDTGIERYYIGFSHANDVNGELRLALPLTLEELFTGVAKRVTFSRIVGRDKNKQLLTRRVTLRVTVPAGVRGGHRMRYENCGNVTRNGHQDLCFTVYEIEHPVYQRDHATLKLFYKGDYLRPSDSMTITSVRGRRRVLRFNMSCNVTHQIREMGMPIRGVADGSSMGDVMLHPDGS